MPRKPRDQTPPPASPLSGSEGGGGSVFRVRGHSLQDPAVGRQVHIEALTSSVHTNGLAGRIGKRVVGIDLAQTSDTWTRDVFERMAPRDPAEEMLVAQLIFAHTRAMHLADLAMVQTGVDSLRVVNEYADRASNTYRRLMLALAEYRRPPRSGDTHIGQANIAAQQVVLNAQGDGNANATNEQGYGPPEAPQRPQTLPALPEGSGIPPGIGGPHAPLDTLHRPPDPRGQGPEPDERMEAR